VRRLFPAALAVALSAFAVLDSARGARINGTAGADRLLGTAGSDAIYGRAGNDRLEGLGGHDLLLAGPGRDALVGGAGDDRLAVQADRGSDSVLCGPGRDVVTAELRDAVGPDCEVVSRQLSRDASSAPEGQHETQVEPHAYAAGSTIVAAFQIGRFGEGGAANIGFATSRNGGASWRSGALPWLSVFGSPAGPYDALSDPVVAYDATHRFWLVASLAGEGFDSVLLVSRSRDGVTWQRPLTAARGDEEFDKEWIVCDNWPKSRFRGSCYLTYLDLVTGRIATRTSRDGGRTWSDSVRAAETEVPELILNGAQGVVRPNGSLVVLYSAYGAFSDPQGDHVGAVRSTDGGGSFGPPRRVGGLEQQFTIGIRAPPFASAGVDGSGRIYAVWSDCRFRGECSANDLALSTSPDGLGWSPPARLPTGAASSVDVFVPSVGVDPARRGSRSQIAVLYHTLAQPQVYCAAADCPGIEIGLLSSTDGARTWSKAQRLSAEPMTTPWLASTSLGAMLGDYVAVPFLRGRPLPVFSLASEPVGGSLRQAIFATTRVVAPLRAR
jgi:hemolysin type calcium-binding protein